MGGGIVDIFDARQAKAAAIAGNEIVIRMRIVGEEPIATHFLEFDGARVLVRRMDAPQKIVSMRSIIEAIADYNKQCGPHGHGMGFEAA
jgi:hypothetical protein